MSPGGEVVAAAHEVVATGGAGATGAACYQCVWSLGLGPEWAAVWAMVLAVAVRLLLDGLRAGVGSWRERRAAQGGD